MKRKLLTILLGVTATAAVNTSSFAQSTLVYYWNFNSFTSIIHLPDTATLAADYAVTGLDTAKARWVFAPRPGGVSSSYASYCDFYTPATASTPDLSDTLNARMGAADGNSFRARNPNDSMEVRIYMPTTGYQNLQIKYADELSSYTSGDSINIFSYSIDSGLTWVTSGTGLSEWSDSGSVAFRLISLHVNDVAAYNNRRFVFRIRLEGRNTGTSGNNRFDNVTLDGDAIHGLSANQVIAPASNYSVYPNPVANILNVNGDFAGEKTVTITNVLGQAVITAPATGANFTINTAALASGVYAMTIRENNTGNTSTVKFTK